MTFHVRITMEDIQTEKSKSVIAIGDTILIKDNTPVIITSDIQRKYNEISYIIDEDAESGKDANSDADMEEAKRELEGDEPMLLTNSRLRYKNVLQRKDGEQRR
jgi:hypothetical protein